MSNGAKLFLQKFIAANAAKEQVAKERKAETFLSPEALEKYYVSVALVQQILHQKCKCGRECHITANTLVKQVNSLRATSIRQIDARRLPGTEFHRLPVEVNYVDHRVVVCHECVGITLAEPLTTKQLELF